MRQTKKVEGTKIAQAAKDLSVTSVTVRRYISEFNIETATDKNGIKVLPDIAMEELKEVRRLKEDGLTNPQVLESIEEQRSKPAKKTRVKKDKDKEEKPKTRAKTKEKEKEKDKDKEKPKSRTKSEPTKRRTRAKSTVDEEPEEAPKATRGRKRSTKVEEEEVEESGAEEESEGEEDGKRQPEGRLKHSLTCQTCGKSFEHMNPRLRDCLDCYRSKRKERRRGGDRHKNVIQHPLAQQVVNKMAKEQQSSPDRERPQYNPPPAAAAPTPFKQQKQVQHTQSVAQPIIGGLKTKVRSYRKAVEETRHITSSLKRRLERPDLPEGDRRWLEQIYAYQLILHQGWRHLSEYRSNTQQQSKKED